MNKCLPLQLWGNRDCFSNFISSRLPPAQPSRRLSESKRAETEWQVEPEAGAVRSVAPGIPWGNASGIPKPSLLAADVLRALEEEIQAV